MSDDACEVVITAPDAAWLADLTRRLIEARLAAGGHNIVPIRSIYRWRGQIYDKTEARVAVHTRLCLVDEINKMVSEVHPYEVPCVIASPIVNGNPAYLQWIIDETAEPTTFK